jgi:hypothetical protein
VALSTSLNLARNAGRALAFSDFADLRLYFLAPVLGALAVAVLWRRRDPRDWPMTAKLFHDPLPVLAGIQPSRDAAEQPGRRRVTRNATGGRETKTVRCTSAYR